MALIRPSTTEALLAAAFTYPRLKDTNFEYPFKEADGPMQHAYKLLGNEKLSQMHTYAIMAHEGRMPSFNQFMFDKYGFSNKLPGHIKDYGYDLDAVMAGIPDEKAKVVDIGGGNGNTILDFKEAYPQLGPNDLIVQDCYANVDSLPGITVMKWDFKDTTPQPVHGAGVYILQHILHNNPDLQAVAILQKVAKAMTADSRLFVVEFTKHTGLASVQASMISLYGGRERSSAEYKQMAELAGLEVTFEGYRFYDECVVEMRKKTQMAVPKYK